MKSFKRVAVTAFAVFILAAGLALDVRGEPMPTQVGFDRSTYEVSASSEVVVRITRVDQEHSAGEDEQFSVECTINGGTAVEGVDYRLVFDGALQGLGTINFPPGVLDQTFTIKALKGAGTEETLVIGLSNPTGPYPVETGKNSEAKITINPSAR